MKKLPLVLALTLIVSGCASSADQPLAEAGQTSAEAAAEAAARAQVEAEARARAQAQAEQTSVKPETEVEDTTCNIDENFGECFFGQTAIYEDSRRDGDEVLLEITVQEPQEFKPGKDADFDTTELGGTPEKGPDNLYFDITIKNLSEEAILGPGDVQLTANSASDGDFDVRTVWDDKVEAYWDAKLKPGRSSTMRSGWNFNDASEPTFEVSIDGLGGNSVTFSHR